MVIKIEIRASVAMATYNGEKYLAEQISSVLASMGDNDELIISDDGSSDATINIINQFINKDKRIKIFLNDCKGIQHNFNNALSHTEGKFIFYCDQDDVWINDKINRVINIFDTTKADLVIHNGYHTNSMLDRCKEDIFQQSKISVNPIRNFIKSTQWGCCMAVNRKSLKYVLPFYQGVGHDIWTGIIIGIYGKITLLNDHLILHRLHEKNVTVRTSSLLFKTKNRFLLAEKLINRINNLNKGIYGYEKK